MSSCTLTFGKEPAEYISRYENMETIIGAFDAEVPVSNTYLIEGVRGCGKTVLMTMVEKELGKRDDWIVISLNSTRDLLEDMAERITNTGSALTDVFRGGFNVSVAGFGVGISGAEKKASSIGTIERFMEGLQKKGKRLLITIDEVMHDDSMRHFASEFQLLKGRIFPVFSL